MLALIQFNLVTFAVAMAIGVATGWWIFHEPGRDDEEPTP